MNNEQLTDNEVNDLPHFSLIPKTEGKYLVSRSGMIYSKITERLLTQRLRRGYPSVRINFDGKSRDLFVHRLVMFAFKGERGRPFQVNHIDGNKENNHINNLEWVTPKQNSKHRDDNNLQVFKFGEDHHSSKVCDNGVELILRLCHDKRYSQAEIAKMFKMSQASISKIYLGLSRRSAKAVMELKK